MPQRSATASTTTAEVPQDGVDDNCDGYADLYSAALATGAYRKIFLGDGASLTAETTLDGCLGYDAAYGDVNGDGYVDIVKLRLRLLHQQQPVLRLRHWLQRNHRLHPVEFPRFSGEEALAQRIVVAVTDACIYAT